MRCFSFDVVKITYFNNIKWTVSEKFYFDLNSFSRITLYFLYLIYICYSQFRFTFFFLYWWINDKYAILKIKLKYFNISFLNSLIYSYLMSISEILCIICMFIYLCLWSVMFSFWFNRIWCVYFFHSLLFFSNLYFIEVQSWWEVPAVAHFCYIFRAPFKLFFFEIAVSQILSLLV